MIFIKINNRTFYVKKNVSILEACKFVGITIPRFCYHESLSVSGNCRMCLVEIEPANNKPVSACTLLIMEEMSILTNTPFVKKARENVLETLLLSHPLDCPICDQGGECDLQDQAKEYGISNSRYIFSKRMVEDKFLGSFIKTIMTRCIHCTRCVRFSEEIAGVKFLGTLNRGQNTEIGSYTVNIFNSNISGNVIDLCPVGALTSKPYAFKARPWELKTNETIDLVDGVGSNIYVSIKETSIVRLTPKKNKNLNDLFISDKTRFSFDALNNLRLNKVYAKKKKWEAINWVSLYSYFSSLVSQKKNSFLISENLCYNTLLNLLSLRNVTGSKFTAYSVENTNSFSNFYTNLFFSNLINFNKKVSSCFILSSNLNFENTLLNYKLRLKHSTNLLNIYSNLTTETTSFPIIFVSFQANNFFKIFESKNAYISKNVFLTENPMFIFGQGFNTRTKNNISFLSFIKQKFPTSLFFFLAKEANTISNAFLNVKNVNTNVIKKSASLFAINLDNTFTTRKLFNINNKIQNFWLHSYNPFSLSKFQLLIPILNIFEFDGIFTNFEGKAQKAFKSVNNLNKEIMSLDFFLSFFRSFYVSEKSNYLNKSSFYFYMEMSTLLNSAQPYNFDFLFLKKNYSNKYFKYPSKPLFEDFYLTNSFTKNSFNMLKRSLEIRQNSNNFLK